MKNLEVKNNRVSIAYDINGHFMTLFNEDNFKKLGLTWQNNKFIQVEIDRDGRYLIPDQNFLYFNGANYLDSNNLVVNPNFPLLTKDLLGKVNKKINMEFGQNMNGVPFLLRSNKFKSLDMKRSKRYSF